MSLNVPTCQAKHFSPLKKSPKEQQPKTPPRQDLSAASAHGGCPCIDSITSHGLFVWTQAKELNPVVAQLAGSKAVPKIKNYLFLSSSIESNHNPEEYCDFVFPILMGWPHHTALNKQWIDRIRDLYIPGTYLAAISTGTRAKVQAIPISMYGQPGFKQFLERLDADLYFVMFSANRRDRTFTLSAPINQIDDLDTVKGYYFPSHIHSKDTMESIVFQMGPSSKLKEQQGNPPTMVIDQQQRQPSQQMIESCYGNVSPNQAKSTSPVRDQVSPDASSPSESSLYRGSCWRGVCQPEEDEAQFRQRTGVSRVMKRYCDLDKIHGDGRGDVSDNLALKKFKLQQEFPSLKDYERFPFFLSRDSYAVLIDRNSHSVSNYPGYTSHPATPYLRVMRPNSYVLFGASVRYVNLSESSTTFNNRHSFSSHTSHPLIVLQEGVKAFDVFYSNDGLDASYVDSVDMDQLIVLDWYQIRLDFKLDPLGRGSKGAICREDDMVNQLTTFKLSAMEYQLSLIGEMNYVEIPEKNLDKSVLDQRLAMCLGPVTYEYYEKRGKLSVIWNVYARIETNDLNSNQSTEPKASSVFLYLKSNVCKFEWKEDKGKPTEMATFEEVYPDIDASLLDLSRVGWSRKQYDEWLIIYRNRFLPYRNSIQQWLLTETRKINQDKYFQRPNSLTEKLIYRNSFYTTHMKGSGKPSEASKKRKQPVMGQR